MTTESNFEAELIAMMGKPKTKALAKSINYVVADAGPKGMLTDAIKAAFRDWVKLPIVASAPKEQKAQATPAAPVVEVVSAPAAQPVEKGQVVFVIELMMKQKTYARRKEINRRVDELKKAGLFDETLRAAYGIWRQVSMGGVVSKDAEPAPAASAEPSEPSAAQAEKPRRQRRRRGGTRRHESCAQQPAPQVAAPEVPEVVIPARAPRQDGPEADREEKVGRRHRGQKSYKAQKSKDERPVRDTKGRRERRPEVEAPARAAPKVKAAGPVVVLKGTTHPNGEPHESPFAALAAIKPMLEQHA